MKCGAAVRFRRRDGSFILNVAEQSGVAQAEVELSGYGDRTEPCICDSG
jgi:hypothetical protein